MKSNSRPSVIITELPVELLLKIFSYTDNIFRNLTQTCQRFNELCSNDFTLRLNFDRIINGEVPIINRDYRKVIIEGSEIPEHLLNLLSSINFDSVSSLKITRAHSEKKGSARFCRILARSYLKLLKMFPNIETLELNSVRLSVILKSDIISVDNQPNLPYLTSLKVRDVNDDVYQCLLKANLIKIDARVVKGGCKNFMNLLQHRKMNLKHLEADNFDYTFNNFRMEALEYLYYDYSVRHFNDNLWLFSSPMLKNCKIKVQYFQLSEMIERKFLLQSQMLKLTIKGVSKETVIQHQPGLLNKFSSVEKLMWENDVIWEKK